MTPEYLKELLPSLLNADFAGATNVRLLSLARTYAALCDLATFDFPSGEYGTRKIWLQRIDTLFGVLRERCRRESDAALRCRMVHAMYTLVCGTVSGDVSKRKGGCFAMADELVRDCLGGNEKRSSLRPDESELLIRTGVCHCLIDLLYPGPDAGDEYLLLLKRQISGWIAEMNRDGSWSGVSPDVALERIGVMNRYSYAFLDKTNDSAVKRSFEYFRNSLPVPEDAGNFDENYLYTLARLYDTAVLGNAYDPDRRLARRIAVSCTITAGLRSAPTTIDSAASAVWFVMSPNESTFGNLLLQSDILHNDSLESLSCLYSLHILHILPAVTENK